MTLEEIVPDIERCNRLELINPDLKTVFVWCVLPSASDSPFVATKQQAQEAGSKWWEVASAPTLGEIVRLLHPSSEVDQTSAMLSKSKDHPFKFCEADTPENAAADLLIWQLENKIVTL